VLAASSNVNKEVFFLDCPLCGNKKNSVFSTTKLPEMDMRQHKCKQCEYVFTSIAKVIEMEALLECAEKVSCEWRESKAKKNTG
jgi:transcriptional regulator NrdR family protein